MPNLVGLRDASPPLSMEDQAKYDTLVAIQKEALGVDRRNLLSTADFKENKASYVPTAHLESQRLVNNTSIGEEEKSKLKGWNNAWTRLHHDGTVSQDLGDVNEGNGQSHRAKLMGDDSIREYTGEANFRGGGHSGRSGRDDHGGRGGGNLSRITGRSGGGKAKGERRVTFKNQSSVQPLTRVRVPKGQDPTSLAVLRRQLAPILKKVPAMTPAKGSNKLPSVPPASSRPPVHYDGMLAAPSAFMASIGMHKEENRNGTIKVPPSAASDSKEKAAGPNVGTSTSAATTTKISSDENAMVHESDSMAVDIPSVETTTAAGKSMASTGSRSKADLMDLDIGQETTQPVLQFTASSTEQKQSQRVAESFSSFYQQVEALENSGSFSTDEMEFLRAIQTRLHQGENPTTPAREAPRQGTYTESELLSLRPVAAVPKVTTGITRNSTEQQNVVLIGEHVHKTRYHTAGSLSEDFEKLSISGKKPAKPAATSLPSEKSKNNPFSPAPAKGKGPSLPAHLLNRATTADHGAAARVQYSGTNEVLAQVSNQQLSADATSSTRPTRRNMINQSGFIALAENRAKSVAAGKKEEDPLVVARKRGS